MLDLARHRRDKSRVVRGAILPKASLSEPEPTGNDPSSVRRSATIWPLAAQSRLTSAEISVLRAELGLSRSSVDRMLAAFRIRPKEATLQWA